jgi:hypothetical protein
MPINLVHDNGGQYSHSAYQRAEQAHRHALNVIEVAGMSAINGSDTEYEEQLSNYTSAEGKERLLRLSLAEFPISSLRDAKSKAAYFRALFDSEWIEIDQEDIRAVLSTFETMSA